MLLISPVLSPGASGFLKSPERAQVSYCKRFNYEITDGAIRARFCGNYRNGGSRRQLTPQRLQKNHYYCTVHTGETVPARGKNFFGYHTRSFQDILLYHTCKFLKVPVSGLFLFFVES